MYGGELDAVQELRRRRLIGLVALIGVLFIGYALNGWRITPFWSLFRTVEGTFVAGDPYDEHIFTVCDGSQQQVAVLRDGRLDGASALSSLRRVRFPDWCSSLPTVDHPDLAEWQAQMRDLNSLIERGAPVASILDSAERLPYSRLYLKPISDWIRADRSHALDFLDTIAVRPMRFDLHPDRSVVGIRAVDFSALVDRAIDLAVLGDLAPDRLERWLAGRQITARGSALDKLARAEGLGVSAKATIIERLDDVPRDRRAGVYLALAPDLVTESRYAALLVEALRFVPRGEQAAAAERLVRQPDASPEFSSALLSGLRSGFGGSDSKLRVFTAIADELSGDPNAPALLTRHLTDISGMERRLAGEHLLQLDGAGETAFAMTLIGSLADFHPMSQPKLIYALMQSRQFADRSVQEACLLAIQLRIRGSTRHELLTAMWRHPAIDDDLVGRIGAELASIDPLRRGGGLQ